MNRGWPLVLLLLLAVSIAACGPAQGRLGFPGDDDDTSPSGFGIDDSALGDADLLEDYSARLFVLNYGGNVSWAITGGSLPPGMSLDSDGTVHGLPTYLGSFNFEVQVTEMTIDDLSGPVVLDVVAGQADLRPGFTHDQTTYLTEEYGLMTDPWLRLAGAGEEMSTYTLELGLYEAGSDGDHEGGGGDDLLVGDLSAEEVVIELGEWDVVGGQPLDDSAPIHHGDGTFEAGSDTGEAPLSITHPDHGVTEVRLFVTAPDWCPEGDHIGGPWQEGYCA